jgi:hypothetical protein
MRLSLPEIIQEHAPIKWSDSVGLFTAICALGYFVVLVGLLRWPMNRHASRLLCVERWFYTAPRVTWLLPSVWLYLACDRVRNAPLFATLAVLAIAEILPNSRWAKYLSRKGWFARPAHLTSRFCAPRWKSLTACLCLTLGISTLVVRHGWAHLDPRIWPVDLLPELSKLNRAAEPEARIFNSYHDGGYLIFFCPRLKVFIDDRCELFGDRMLRDYVQAEQSDPGRIEAWHERYGFNSALVRNDTPFDRFLQADRRWKLVQRGACASLYKRADSLSSMTMTRLKADGHDFDAYPVVGMVLLRQAVPNL